MVQKYCSFTLSHSKDLLKPECIFCFPFSAHVSITYRTCKVVLSDKADLWVVSVLARAKSAMFVSVSAALI